MSEKTSKRKVLAFAWFTLNNKALQIGFLDSDGKIDKDKTYVCFVPDLIDAFGGFRHIIKVYKQLPFDRAVRF